MAKRPNEQIGQRPNSRLRVLFVELDGADSTIEEALRTVERMRRAPEAAQQLLKRIANPANDTPEQTASEDTASAEQVADQFNGDAETEQRAATKRGQGPKKDHNAGIELVGDLNFVPKNEVALKSFFTEKSPSSDMDQVLVICYYLQHTLKLANYGPGHILSGFKHVGEPIPVDLKSTIRNMKKGKAWLNFTDLKNIHTTTEGDNRVEHQLGKGENGEDV
jgi:hypothetical protein